MTIEAKIIADSISEDGNRLTTMQLMYPRFIHSEFMTHRVFSRNASSSRAIPITKMIQSVRDNPAMPIHWGKNQPGMQADEEVDKITMHRAKVAWLGAMDNACRVAGELQNIGVHKQLANRLLEPFQHIHVVVTSTEWDNFFALRHHPNAQPEFQELAAKMHNAHDTHVPMLVAFGDWHLPYTRDSDGSVPRRILKSAASCARVSYTNHEGKESTDEEDAKLYLRLITADPPHMSPVEHQAMAVPGDKFYANFRGWRQHRWELERGGLK